MLLQVVADAYEPVSEFIVPNSLPLPRLSEALINGKCGRGLPIGQLFVAKSKDGLQWISKNASRQMFRQGDYQCVLFYGAVLILVHEHPLIGCFKNAGNKLPLNKTCGSRIDFRPFVPARLTRCESRPLRKCRRKSQRPTGNRLQVGLMESDALLFHPLAERVHARQRMGENQAFLWATRGFHDVSDAVCFAAARRRNHGPEP